MNERVKIISEHSMFKGRTGTVGERVEDRDAVYVKLDNWPPYPMMFKSTELEEVTE